MTFDRIPKAVTWGVAFATVMVSVCVLEVRIVVVLVLEIGLVGT